MKAKTIAFAITLTSYVINSRVTETSTFKSTMESSLRKEGLPLEYPISGSGRPPNREPRRIR